MLTRMMVPEMEKRGYDRAFSCAVTAAGSLVTPIIPPGIALIIYGLIADVSIGKMFMAGIIPGILGAVILMIAAYITSVRRGYKPSRDHVLTGGEVREALISAWPAVLLIMPLFSAARWRTIAGTRSAEPRTDEYISGATSSTAAMIIRIFSHAFVRTRRKPDSAAPSCDANGATEERHQKIRPVEVRGYQQQGWREHEDEWHEYLTQTEAERGVAGLERIGSRHARGCIGRKRQPGMPERAGALQSASCSEAYCEPRQALRPVRDSPARPGTKLNSAEE